MIIPSDGQVILQGNNRQDWLYFDEPVTIYTTDIIEEVLPELVKLEERVNRQGLFAAGFIAYEAAPAFDPAFKVVQTRGLPLIWFGLYKRPVLIKLPTNRSSFQFSDWQPSIRKSLYLQAVSRIKNHISMGDTYQVNYTFRLKSDFRQDSWSLFLDLVSTQHANFAAYIDIGSHVICSVSPELFFKLDDSLLISRPMKGTIHRGRTLSEDDFLSQWLYHSDKNRAENVMIVDMIRNDMGRVCDIGSIEVSDLFQIERYPTLWQLTSTIKGSTGRSIVDIIQALFPCASITGAPKVRTMEIIADLETEPRGIYTGAIGYFGPDRQAQFNVAIRTLQINRQSQEVLYGVGGGIVWDSDPHSEYDECWVKSSVLFAPPMTFELLETILWSPSEGFFLLDHHMERIANSASYFGIEVNISEIRARLLNQALTFPTRPQKVRLLVGQKGRERIENDDLDTGISVPERAISVGFAIQSVDPTNVFLYHKTTRRDVYEAARASRPDCDDVILWNDSGFVTESTTANVVVKLDGKLITPPVECGLLAGTFRSNLLAKGEIVAGPISKKDMLRSENLYLINSVRKWMPARLADTSDDYP